MHSTRYVVTFILIVTSIVALVLTFLFTTWKDKTSENEAIFNKRAILKAINSELDTNVDDMGDEEVLGLFGDNIQQLVLDMDGQEVETGGVESAGYKGGLAEHIDMAKEKKKPEAERILPLFVYNNAGKKYYIVSVRGNGLWDEIWGNIAIDADFNTIIGVNFDHKAETPGLGAEIKDNPAFPAQFKGKKLFDGAGNYKSVFVRKGGAKDKTHEVDGISGATVTADGVTEMLKRGLQYYQPYFKQLKSGSKSLGAIEQAAETEVLIVKN